MNKFAKELTRAIETDQISISELSRRTGISRIHIYRLMRGEQMPGLDTAEAVLKHIGFRIAVEKVASLK